MDNHEELPWTQLSYRELGSLLTVAIGHSQLIQRRLVRGTTIVDEQTRQSLNAIEVAIAKAANILRSLEGK